MYTVDEGIEKFKEILSDSTTWNSLVDSQFVEHLATFVAWTLRQAQWEVERAKQEYFASVALNASSIMAHAEDRDYIPVKPEPSTGVLSIQNNGESAVTIPSKKEFENEDDVVIRTTASISILSGETGYVNCSQTVANSYYFTVDETIVFYQILLDQDIAKSITSYEVYVDENDGAGYRKYTYSRLLQNISSTARAYDEFYSHTNQVGIRFGNGIFGKIPQLNWSVRVDTVETDGEIFISSGQELFLVNSLSDSSGNDADLTITVSTSLSGGSDFEDTESIRNNLTYWPVYDENIVWSDDYVFFLKRRFSDIIFAKCWGEQEAEEIFGYSSYDFINKIFICAYAPDNDDLESDSLNALENVEMLNKTFEWQDVVHVQFTVTIIGKVLSDVVLSDAIQDIKDDLELYYGKDSTSRRDEVSLHEVYEIIQDTGYFEASSGAKFNVSLSGTYEPNVLYEMVSIDIENSTFDIEYVS